MPNYLILLNQWIETQTLSMNNYKLLLLLLLPSLFMLSCAKEDLEPEKGIADINLQSFSFLKANNPSLKRDVPFNIEENKIYGSLPPETDMTKLIASFTLIGGSAFIGETPLESGETLFDYSEINTLEIKGDNGSDAYFELEAIRFTGLPIFYITTDGGASISSTEEYVSAHISFDGAKEFEDFEDEILIRGRGNSTWYFHDKKAYQVKFEEKTSILGMPADRKWIFLAEHSDKTLLRNTVALEMGRMSNLEYTPQHRFAEVFLNDDYVGTYNITQKVEESKNRLDIGDDGYLLEIDQLYRLDDDDVYFYTSPFLICVKEPKIDSISPEYDFINAYVNKMEEVFNSDYFNHPDSGYKKYIDVDSFIDWYIINEITKNQDAKDYSSIFMHLIPGEKLKMGPIWDFDLAFGNVYYSDCKNPTGFWVKDHAWYSKLFQDQEFVNRMKSRFQYYRSQEEYLLHFVDETAYQLRIAQQENDDKWHVYGEWLWPNNVVLGSHQEEVDYLKSWLSERMDWLNEAYGAM